MHGRLALILALVCIAAPFGRAQEIPTVQVTYTTIDVPDLQQLQRSVLECISPSRSMSCGLNTLPLAVLFTLLVPLALAQGTYTQIGAAGAVAGRSTGSTQPGSAQQRGTIRRIVC
jgi:uncharacterized membrane protein